jgi:hypothetical protein
MIELVTAINELNITMQQINRSLKQIHDEIYIGTLPEEVRHDVRADVSRQRLMQAVESSKESK